MSAPTPAQRPAPEGAGPAPGTRRHGTGWRAGTGAAPAGGTLGRLAAGQTVHLPTTGVLLVALAAGVLHLTARVTGGAWLALGAAAVLALPLVSVLLRPALQQLEVRRSDPGRAAVGDRVPVELLVTNAGPRAVPPVLVRDLLPGYAPVVVALPALAAGATARVRSQRTAVRRVSADAGDCCLRAGSPVGLLAAHRHLRPSGRVVVHPARVPAHRLTHLDGGDGPTVALPGSAPEVLGLRDWRPGQGAALSARATARHGRPLVLEREREGGGTLVVLVTEGRGDAWESCLAVAAALATDAVRAGSRTVLVGVPRPVGPGVVPVLDALSAADAAPPLSEQTLRTALSAARGGGVLVLVAPPEALETRLRVRAAAAAARVALVVPAGTTPAGDQLPARPEGARDVQPGPAPR